jgi:ornithine cyclodeaminase
MNDPTTLIVTHAEVERLLPMPACIDVMRDALGALANGDAQLPLRQVLRLSGGGGRNAFASMPAVLGNAIGAKIITVFPDNENTPYDAHIGVVLYFEPVHGRLLAVLDASAITAIRTAAVSGLATRLLARPDASTLAVLGTGVQAATHVEAVCCVRPINDVRVYGRDDERRRTFAAAMERRFTVPCRATSSAEEAVRGADVVCTTTSSRTPVLQGAWLEPGCHINAVGASVPTARELDSAAVARSRLFVDRRESVLNEAGDFLIPRSEGEITDAHILSELGDVVLGRATGRATTEEITLFKSLGLAVEDVAAARFIYERARAEGAGVRVAIGGLRP